MRGHPVRRPGSGGGAPRYLAPEVSSPASIRCPLSWVSEYSIVGNAAGECVPMSASLSVLALMMTGMGGDAFLLFYEAETGYVRGANGAGRAPRLVFIEEQRSRRLKA